MLLRYKTICLYFLLCCFLFSFSKVSYSKQLFSTHQFGKNSAVLVVDPKGETLYSWNSDKPLIPASTIKIITAIAAMDIFGGDFRFKTNALFKNNTLYIKGFGDPYLTSEELDIFAHNVHQKIRTRFLTIDRIVVDGTHFPLLSVPGRSATSQPYDAPLSAVSANFNTINIKKVGSVITSAEPQTPITPLAKTLSAKLTDGTHRINLVKTENSEQYFAELFAEKLKSSGFERQVELKTGFTPFDAELIYQHVNSKTMAEMVHAMLFYSNNFIANQLFLQMREQNQAVSFDASSAFVSKMLAEDLQGSAQTSLVEGSGLSRENRMTANQLLRLLKRFQPDKTLMKSYLDGKAFAKSGTLDGVQNLAGYVTKHNQDYYFVFLFNDSVPWQFRNTLLSELYATL